MRILLRSFDSFVTLVRKDAMASLKTGMKQRCGRFRRMIEGKHYFTLRVASYCLASRKLLALSHELLSIYSAADSTMYDFRDCKLTSIEYYSINFLNLLS